MNKMNLTNFADIKICYIYMYALLAVRLSDSFILWTKLDFKLKKNVILQLRNRPKLVSVLEETGIWAQSTHDVFLHDQIDVFASA